MSEINQVLQFAMHLQSTGKTPTTALLKATLGKSVPMPTILKGLQQFKSLSKHEIEQMLSVETESIQKQNTKLVPLEEQVKQLTQKVIQLQNEQAALLQRIEQLEKK